MYSLKYTNYKQFYIFFKMKLSYLETMKVKYSL